jgi:DNA-binding NarL/FixJ family response regulator
MSAVSADRRAKARVLIAADHGATRAGMRTALDGEAECSEVADADTAVAAALRERPDVCLINFSSPGRGIRTAAEITASIPGASVVVMTERIDEDEFLTAIQAGAIGYLPHQIDPLRLPQVIRSVMRGEAAVPRMLVGRLLDELRDRERRRVALRERQRVELTEREWQVVRALQQGMTTRQIAEQLGVAEVTVRRHVSGVLHKAGVRTRPELLGLLPHEGAPLPETA